MFSKCEKTEAARRRIRDAITTPRLPAVILTALSTISALTIFVHALYTAPHVLPFWDDFDSVFEPIAIHSSNYFTPDSTRIFFRPLEYFLNYEFLRSGHLWMTLALSTVLSALAAVMAALILRYQKEQRGDR